MAADNALYIGRYDAERDGPVVFTGVGHAVDDDNYLVTKVKQFAVKNNTIDNNIELYTWYISCVERILVVSRFLAVGTNQIARLPILKTYYL